MKRLCPPKLEPQLFQTQHRPTSTPPRCDSVRSPCTLHTTNIESKVAQAEPITMQRQEMYYYMRMKKTMGCSTV